VVKDLARVNTSYRKGLAGSTTASAQQIADTGHQLATALRVGDQDAVTGLIKRFGFLLSHQPNVSQAQHDAVKSYDNRLVGITRLQGKIQAEHQRLQNELG
jgi:hypothetical protein